MPHALLHPARRRRTGFTLIEVMVVVGIIVVLVAAVVAVGTNVRTNSMIKTTHATLSALKMAKTEYYEVTQKEPTSAYFLEFKAIPSVWRHLQKLPRSSFNAQETGIVDAWGNAITYTQSGSSVPEGYFQSSGPDGVAGGSGATDDLRSTEAPQ